jgi:hypothetical protein
MGWEWGLFFYDEGTGFPRQEFSVWFCEMNLDGDTRVSQADRRLAKAHDRSVRLIAAM